MGFIGGGVFKKRDCWKCSAALPGVRIKKRVFKFLPCPPGYSVAKPTCRTTRVIVRPNRPPTTVNVNPGAGSIVSLFRKDCVKCSGNTKITKKCMGKCGITCGGSPWKAHKWKNAKNSKGWVWNCAQGKYIGPAVTKPIPITPHAPHRPSVGVLPGETPSYTQPINDPALVPHKPIGGEEIAEIAEVDDVSVPELVIPDVVEEKYEIDEYQEPTQGLTAEDIRAIIQDEMDDDDDAVKTAGMSTNSMLVIGLIGVVVVLAIRKS